MRITLNFLSTFLILVCSSVAFSPLSYAGKNGNENKKPNTSMAADAAASPQSPDADVEFDLSPSEESKFFQTPEKNRNAVTVLLNANQSARTFDYSEELHLRHGDWIYGLQVMRGPTVNAIRAQFSDRSQSFALTIDEFNQYALELFSIKYTPPTLPFQFSTWFEDLVSSGRVSQIDRNRLYRYLTFFFTHQHYFNPHKFLDENSYVNTDQFFRSACKAAIFFAQKENRKIHFILDGLDINAPADEENHHYESFTSVELRSIFKTWLGNPQILDTVLFYQYGKKLNQAPWLDEDGQLLPQWKAHLKNKQ